MPFCIPNWLFSVSWSYCTSWTVGSRIHHMQIYCRVESRTASYTQLLLTFTCTGSTEQYFRWRSFLNKLFEKRALFRKISVTFSFIFSKTWHWNWSQRLGSVSVDFHKTEGVPVEAVKIVLWLLRCLLFLLWLMNLMYFLYSMSLMLFLILCLLYLLLCLISFLLRFYLFYRRFSPSNDFRWRLSLAYLESG